MSAIERGRSGASVLTSTNDRTWCRVPHDSGSDDCTGGIAGLGSL